MTVRVAAVMSTFHPEQSALSNAEAVAGQVDRLFVVDDTGGVSALGSLVSATVSVLSNAQNVGLASSLNRGIEAAMEWGATHILTLDDDTTLPEGYVAAIVTALIGARERELPVLTAGPRTVNGSRTAYGEVHTFREEECSIFVMQSGLLFDVEAFQRFGMFRDELFIDAIEPDFLARLHREGLHTLLVRDLDLPHSVGDPRVIDLGFRTVTTSNHSAFRFYYITRNMLTFVRENKRDEPVVSRMTKSFLRREIVKSALFEDQRREKLAAAWQGYRDYRRGALGKRPS